MLTALGDAGFEVLHIISITDCTQFDMCILYSLRLVRDADTSIPM